MHTIYQKLLSLSLGVAKTNTLEIEKIIEDLIELGNSIEPTVYAKECP